MSATETMMKTILKAMGFEPEQFILGAQNFIRSANDKLNSITDSFAQQDEKLDHIVRLIEANHVQVVLHLEEIKPSMRPCLLEPDPTLSPIVMDDDTVVEFNRLHNAA